MRRTCGWGVVVALLGGLTLGGCDKKAKEGDSRAQRMVDAPGASGERSAPISAADRKTLLTLARRSLNAATSGLYPRSLTDGLRISPRLKVRQGAFVTLTKAGRLRGCIGYILPRAPLYLAVIKNAANAAIHDRRFPKVSPGEAASLEIEISALSVPRRVKSYREIAIGKHGIILGQGARSATFLPHVAPQQKWDRATTLTRLSRKAGLPGDAWKDPGTEFQVYTAEVWSESGGAH